MRPNIVFIMADDHAPHALGCYGASLAQTPHLDRLANEGMLFTNAMDTVALCGPSRAVLLTGKYSHLNGFCHNEGKPFDGDQPTFPKELQKAGMQTAVFGKWHLESEPTGFDHYSVIPGHGQFWNCPFIQPHHPWPEGEEVPGYLTDVITDQAIHWMETARTSGQPFCALIHHKAPHTPHEYPEAYEQFFQEDLPTPDSFDDEYESRPTLRDCEGKWSKFSRIRPWDLGGNELGGEDVSSHEGPEFKEWAYQVFMKGYLRLVKSLDDNVGRVLEYLDETGLSENTLVVYTSDNGFFLGDHGLYNKMWMYEQSLGIPLIARYPGRIQPGAVESSLVSLIDLSSTFLDLAGASPMEGAQGHSLLPALEGQSPCPRDTHYYHYYAQFDVPSQCGIRTYRHKLICFYGQPPPSRWELYDLEEDPGEFRNLADDPAHQTLLTEMQDHLRCQAALYQDPVQEHL